MSHASFLPYLDTALALAHAAGTLLSEGALSRHPAQSKSVSNDLVTAYDRAAEDLIVSGLRARYPDHRILGEEGGDRGGDARAPRWIIDPLDGTTNFAHGLPLFSVSIACEVDGELAVGVVMAPALNMTFAAMRGHGATRNGLPIHVSDVDTLDSALLVTGFPYDRRTARENNFAQFVALKKKAQGIRRLGSAALDLAFTAAGSFDGYWEMRLSPWDVAAGILLVQEAGGTVTDWKGLAVSLERCEVLASNGRIHDAMRGVLTTTQHGQFT
jgi:myo-inositol-1(or 4)-monophosphatase